MRKTLALVRRELVAYFSSPLAYVVLTLFLFMQGWVFVLIMNYLNRPQVEVMEPLRLVFGGTLFFWLFLMFTVAAVTMRLIAEERRSGTIEVLLTSPVTETQVVIGKYLGALIFYMTLWIPTLAYVLILSRYAAVDLPTVGSFFLGVLFLGVLFNGIGIFTSALSRNQIIAAVLAFAIFIVVFSLGLVEQLVSAPALRAALGYMNLWSHMDDFARGIVDTRHLVYEGSVGALFVFLAVQALQAGKGR